MARDSTEATKETSIDEELRDILIAISVVAKRLARKIEANQQQTQAHSEGGS